MALTVEQLGQQVQEKYPQYKNMDASKVGQAVLKKYPQYGKMVGQTSQDEGWGQTLEDFLPSIFGTAGMIGGAMVPGVGETGVSEVAGGALGSGAGEWLKNQLQGKKQSMGDIAQSGAEGGLFSLAPGGEEGGSFITNLISRLAGGAAVGAGAQGVADIGNKKTLAQNLPGIATAGGETAIINAGFPMITSLLKGPLSLIGQGLEKSGKAAQDFADQIEKAAIDKPAQLKKELEDASVSYRFGNDNVDFAKNNNLISDKGLTIEGVNEELGNAQKMAKDTEKQLQSKLEGVKMDVYPIWNMINRLKEYLPEEASRTKAAIDGFLSKAADENGGRIARDAKVSAKAVLDLKRAVGEAFDPSNPGSIDNKIYDYLKTAIENDSGVPSEVKGLNDTAHRSSVAASNLKKLKSGFGGFSDKFTPSGIASAVAKAAKGNVDEVAHLLDLVGVPISLGGYMLGHFPGYIVARNIEPLIRKSIERPQNLEKTVSQFSGTGQALQNAGQKVQAPNQVIQMIMKILQQIGMRGTTTPQNQPGGQTQQPQQNPLLQLLRQFGINGNQ